MQQLWNTSQPLAEFILGTMYQWLYDNGASIRELLQPLKLSPQEENRWRQVLPQSRAFRLGQTVGGGAAIVQGILEFVAGSGAVGGGGSLCLTTGVGCFASAPAIAGGVILQAHGASTIWLGLNEEAKLLRELLSPAKMESSGFTGPESLAGELGVSSQSIEKSLEVISPEKVRQLHNELGTGLFKSLTSKSKELIGDVSRSLDLIGNDIVALDDIKTVLGHRKGKITDIDMKNVFSQMKTFLEKFHGRVSGANAERFARANAPGLNEISQAKGEIKTAEDLLDGKALVKDTREIYAIPETLVSGQKNPDYLITAADGSTRLAEVKTPNGNMSVKNMNDNIKMAIKQIALRDPTINPTKKAYIRLDYTSTAPNNNRRDWIFEKLSKHLTDDIELNKGTNIKGVDYVEFVEVLYKDAKQGGAGQKVEIQVQNGTVRLL